MDNFMVIFKILSILESSLDDESVDMDRLSAKALNISENRLNSLLKMLSDSGYIEGVSVRSYNDGGVAVIVNNIKITLAGLEYLSENSLMKKAYNMAKGIADLIP
ncbi:YjcQ family protein [Peptoanaerobacter stomatis]